MRKPRLINDAKQLADLKNTAELFRRAMIESGAINCVPQIAYIDQLRALECALNDQNYKIGRGST